MIEGVLKGKGLVTISEELGVKACGGAIEVGTDSSAAKSFVSRRGLGRMRHIEVRDLWLRGK